MTQKPTKKPVKFLIDGDIKSPKESAYLKNIDKVRLQKSIRINVLLSILVLVTTTGLCWFAWKHQQASTSLAQIKQDSTVVRFSQRLDSLKLVNDSLFLANAKLVVANEVLVENSDQPEGIFFEVHLNFSGDFNLEAYLDELRGLESKEFDNREKLRLARFRSFKKALLFENDLKKMGVPDVFLLGRVDGQIMTFKEALAIAQSQNN
ncbi:MAG: hypothetical protein JJ975_00155 [Bacteroidia bacterium]|nr:hypothetical protein [Bacteroidia bacterium]